MGTRRLLISLFFTCLNLLTIACFSQKKNSSLQLDKIDVSFPFPTFEKITTDNGLSFNEVYEMIQDKKGFLWFLTGNGLNRYDGYSFKTYTYDPSDSNSLTGGWFYSLEQDKDGLLWMNSESEGIYSFNPVTETFFNYRHLSQDRNSLIDDRTEGLAIDKSGNIWIATQSGLDKLEPKANKFTHISHQPYKQTNVSNNYISAITIDEDDNLWLVTAIPGIDYFNTKSQTLIQHFSFGSSANPIEDWNIHPYGANAGRNGNIWIGSRTNGLYGYNTRTKKISHFVHQANNSYSLSNNGVYKVFEDRNGNLWLATDAGGGTIEYYDHATGRFYHKPFDDIQHLDILEDNSGKIWICTMNGIYTCSPLLKRFESYTHNDKDIHSLSHKYVYSFLRDRSGHFLVGSNRVNYFDSATKKFSVLKADEIPDLLLSNNYVFKIVQDSKNVLWFATLYGLISYNPATKKHRWYQSDQKDSTSLGASSCTGFIEDRKGRYWATTWGGGFEAFNPASGKFRYFMVHEGKNGISTNSVGGIFESSKGLLYIGSWNGGLITFNPDKESFKIYKHKSSNPNSPSGDIAANFLESKKGIIWFCTNGGGINAFDPVTEKFRAFTTKDGLCSNNVMSIVSDNYGSYWLGTQNGLSCFTPPEDPFDSKYHFCFRNYSKSDGLPDNRMALFSAYKDVDGKLYFGTEYAGFYCFRPELLKDNTYVPPVYITGLKIFNKNIRPHDADSILKMPVEQTKEITLSYKQNDISLEFTGLNYIHPEKNKYAYKLKGYNKDWINTDASKRFANYTNLDPGDYTFLVKASNNDGIWNETPASVHLIITPPFWETWWFRSLLIAIVVVVIFGIYRYRLQEIIKLQSIRNKISADLHDDIGSTLNSISIYSEVAKQDSSNYANALEMIGEASRKVIDAMSDIVWTINPENDSFENIVLRMRSLAFNLMRAKNIEFSFHASESLNNIKLSMEKRRNFFLIFKEAINNLIKYSDATLVSIQLVAEGQFVKLTIHDNGKGFDPTLPVNGNGLISMNRRAKEMKANFEIHSSAGEGTHTELLIKL
jgi:ligand-binding sensor domain-containing protein/two-component sensor histidine kinase